MADHYFSEDPGAPERRRDLRVTLLGRDLRVGSSAGVFSGDGLDHATAVLLRELDASTSSPQCVLDLGCGWGPIALSLALKHPGADVWAVDVNDRALALTSANAERHDLEVRTARPEGVPSDLRFGEIWSNPPIRIGKEALHALLLTWLARLNDDGVMMMVVGRNLGADSLQRWLIDQGHPTERVASSKGFRVLAARRPLM